MASGVVVILGTVLVLAEITPVSHQPQQAAWSSLLDVRSSRCGAPWAYRVRVLRTPAVAGHAAVPDPLDRVQTCTLEGPGDTWRSRTPRGSPGLWLRVMGIPLRGACGDTGPPPEQEVGPGPCV